MIFHLCVTPKIQDTLKWKFKYMKKDWTMTIQSQSQVNTLIRGQHVCLGYFTHSSHEETQRAARDTEAI